MSARRKEDAAGKTTQGRIARQGALNPPPFPLSHSIVLLAQFRNRGPRGAHLVGQYPVLCLSCDRRFYLTDRGCPGCASDVRYAMPLYGRAS